jgi:hypothetical protein
MDSRSNHPGSKDRGAIFAEPRRAGTINRGPARAQPCNPAFTGRNCA